MKAVTSTTIFGGFLVLYTLTLRPGVLPADSGEFQLAATQLTIAHPPGFPLYVLMGWLFTRLPGNPAAILNFLSAIFSALTLAMLPWIISEAGQAEKGKDWSPLGALFAAVMLGTSTTVWSQATTTNIRSLTTLFAALGFFCLLRWLNLRQDKWLIGAVAVMSFGVTHHLSLAFVALVMVGVVLSADWTVLQRPQLSGRLALAVAAGLLPWLLLPVLEPSLRDPQDFFIYVTGLGFGNDFFFIESIADLVRRLGIMLGVFSFQFPAFLVIFASCCLGWLVFINPRAGSLLLGSGLLMTIIAATYRAPQTVEYMLPAYLILSVAVGWFISTMMGNWAEIKGKLYRSAFFFTLFLAVLGIIFLPDQIRSNWQSYRWLSNQHDTLNYVQEIFDHAPENSIVYATWHWFTPLIYIQQIEGERPDLEIVYVNPDFNDDWAGAIEQSLGQDRPVIATNFNPDTYHLLPPHHPLDEAFLWTNQPIDRLPATFLPVTQTFGELIELDGVQPIDPTVAMGESLAMTVAWRPIAELPPVPLKLFVHLVGSDGRIYAQQDLGVTAQVEGISQTRFVLTPRPGIPLDEAQLLFGAYLADGTPLLNRTGEPRSEIGRVEITGTRWRPITGNDKDEVDPETGYRLVGADFSRFAAALAPTQFRLYRHWQLPDGTYWTSVEDVDRSAVPEDEQQSVYIPLGQGLVWHGHDLGAFPLDLQPGDRLDITQTLSSNRPILRDIGIAVRQVGYEEDLFTWAWLNPDPDNDIPAMGAIPTLKWVQGSHVHHPRLLTIPENAQPGQSTEGFLRLYDVFTREPVPILDERVTADGRPWIRFGLFEIQSEN